MHINGIGSNNPSGAREYIWLRQFYRGMAVSICLRLETKERQQMLHSVHSIVRNRNMLLFPASTCDDDRGKAFDVPFQMPICDLQLSVDESLDVDTGISSMFTFLQTHQSANKAVDEVWVFLRSNGHADMGYGHHWNNKPSVTAPYHGNRRCRS